jgi:hypothetical protein
MKPYFVMFIKTGPAGKLEIETTSNSSSNEEPLSGMSSHQLTAKLFQHLKLQKPVGINARMPSMDDVHCVMSHNFRGADEQWRRAAPKNVVSRLVSVQKCNKRQVE